MMQKQERSAAMMIWVVDRGRSGVPKWRVRSLSRTQTIYLVEQEQNQGIEAEMQVGENVVTEQMEVLFW